ncbi:MAG: helix-turn-helix transcriptional regulator [Candidatus Woesearchaeota archaeon]
MRNKYVGIIVVGISLLIGFLVWLFNKSLSDIVNESCNHGSTCPMWGSIRFQTNVGLGLMVFVVLVGLYLIFFARDDPQIVKEVHREVKIVKEQVRPKKFDKAHFKDVLETLDKDARIVLEKVIANNGSIFQSQLVEDLGLSKVKTTRILDRLEGKGMIERKRRGMTNVVLLKHE